MVALAVVNAWGDVLGPDSQPVFAPPSAPAASWSDISEMSPGPLRSAASGASSALGNTTVAVLLTDARLSKNDCFLLAQSGHTGFARALHPAHSRYDGDAVVALATGEVPDADLDLLRAVGAEVMADAIRSAVAYIS